MRKKPKSTIARAEGGAAAQAALGRNANPYPQSLPDNRDEWFKGYDETLNKPAGSKRKRG